MKKTAALTTLLTSIALWGVSALAQNRGIVAAQKPEWSKFNPVTPLTAASFTQPPASDLPWVRMNMPQTADPAELVTSGKR